ncbi:MAG: VWA domain-containing protein [Oligoflexia bacterium]|nr:VWA domain-containing protein [Oligoflexia bacterium]
MINRVPLRSLAWLVVGLLLWGCHEQQVEEKPAEAITVRLVHGAELTNYLTPIQEDFNNRRHTLSDGTPIKLELIAESGLSAARAMAKGELKTALWLSPSSALIDFVNTHLTNLGPPQVDCKQLFATPIVLAVNSNNTALFAANDHKFSWREFIEGKLGAAAGGARVSFSHSNPLTSSSGLAALTQLAYLASYTHSADLDYDTLTSESSLKRLKNYELLATAYTAGDSSPLSRLANAPGGRASFVLTTEFEVANFNRRKVAGAAQLAALYPTEGTYWEDYNLCTSDADWVTTAHRAAIRQVVGLLSSEAAQLKVKGFGFRPSIVHFEEVAPLTSEFGVNPQLPTTSLQPAPGNVVNHLLDSWPKLMKPLAVMLVVDTSGSMENALAIGQEQFRNWIAASPARDQKGLISFSSEAKVLAPFSGDSLALIQQLDPLKSIGGSALYDAVKRAFDYVSDAALNDYRRSIILYTDGEDKNSQVSLDLLSDIVRQKSFANDINFIVIAIQRGSTDFSDLKRLTKEANGVYREGDLFEIDKLFAEILRSV